MEPAAGVLKLQLIVNIVVLASIYALIACGYVLIYRVSRVLNLAHGELMMLGAYLLLATASLFAGSPVLAIAAAITLSATAGVLVYVFLMRKMTGEMVLAAILTTVALGILVRGALVLIWSSQQQYPAQALHVANPTLTIGTAHVSAWSLTLVSTERRGVRRAVHLPALRPLGHAHARGGPERIACRPAGHQPAPRLRARLGALDLYRSRRRHADRARFRRDHEHAGDRTEGVSRRPRRRSRQSGRSAAGALIVASAEVLLIYYVDPLLSDVVPFVVLLAMPIVRPWGLFGTREELDRV